MSEFAVHLHQVKQIKYPDHWYHWPFGGTVGNGDWMDIKYQTRVVQDCRVTCHSLCEHLLCARPCSQGPHCQVGAIRKPHVGHPCLGPTLPLALILKESQNSPDHLSFREQTRSLHSPPLLCNLTKKGSVC